MIIPPITVEEGNQPQGYLFSAYTDIGKKTYGINKAISHQEYERYGGDPKFLRHCRRNVIFELIDYLMEERLVNGDH